MQRIICEPIELSRLALYSLEFRQVEDGAQNDSDGL